MVLTARPSWAKLSPVCRALKARGVDLQIVVCASGLLERYGDVSKVVEAEGFPIAERVYSVLEGATLETSAIEVGVLQSSLARTYARLKPDLVVVCADRREILAAGGAARMLELKILHMQGGEKSGCVDDDIRDAVTHLSDYHCVCTELAAYRVYGLTGHWTRIWNTGCPSIDLAKHALAEPPVTVSELGGSGATIDLAKPFVVVLQHPVTNEVAMAGEQMRATLDAVCWGIWPAVVFWPGEDAGADAMSKVIREYQPYLHAVRSLPPVRFLKLLTHARVLIGNSSAGIRESAFLGTPVIDIGSRQQGRERAANTVHLAHSPQAILKAIQQQIAHGPYPSSSLYGTGTAGEQIAEVICEKLGFQPTFSSRPVSIQG